MKELLSKTKRLIYWILVCFISIALGIVILVVIGQQYAHNSQVRNLVRKSLKSASLEHGAVKVTELSTRPQECALQLSEHYKTRMYYIDTVSGTWSSKLPSQFTQIPLVFVWSNHAQLQHIALQDSVLELEAQEPVQVYSPYPGVLFS